MKISAFVKCFSLGGKENRRSGCAIILFAVAPDGRCLRRQLAFSFGSSTVNLAGLQAVRLAILSLRPWVFKNRLSVSIMTDSHYALDMLAKSDNGGYRADPKVNADAVAALRKLYDASPGVVLEFYKSDDGIGERCLAIARDVTENQSTSDGGTMEFANVIEAGFQTQS